MIPEKDLYRPKVQEKAQEPDSLVYFTLFGKQDFFLDDYPVTNSEVNAFAYRQTKNGRTKFYARFDNNGRLYNPLDQWLTNSHEKLRHNTGQRANDFREVPHNTFWAYLKFLRTQNEARYREAQREI